MSVSDPSDLEVIRVLVVDDHPVVRAGLRAMLAGSVGFAVVGEAANGDGIAELALQTRPDVVLMDLRMGAGVDGVGATAALVALANPPRVLVLTVYDTDQDILRAIEAGATGYLLKDAPPETLLDAIRRAAAGETVLAAPIAGRLARRVRSPEPALTSRELEILGHVAAGRTNRDIATDLHLSEATVKSHVAHIYVKLGVDSRAAATSTALTRGLIRTSGPGRAAGPPTG